MGIEGGIIGINNEYSMTNHEYKMEEQDKRRFMSRLRRMVGQTQALERVLAENDSPKFVGQLEAVIAAGRATLSQYAELELINSDDPEDKRLLSRLLRKG